MKKVLKRVMSALLCATMLAGAMSLCACEKKADAETLVWYMPADANQPGKDAVVEEINKITQEKIGVNIDLRFIDESSYNQRLEMMLASGEEMDLCFIGYLYTLQNAIRKEALTDITEYVKNLEVYDTIDEDIWKSCTYEGKLYAVPNIQIMSMGTAAVFRKDMVDKYGLDLDSVNSYNDLIPFFEKIRDNEPDLIPERAGACFAGEFDKTRTYDLFYDLVRYNPENDKVEVSAEMPGEYNRAVLCHEFYQKGFVRKDAATVTDDTADLNAGRYVQVSDASKPGDAEERTRLTGHEYVSKEVIPGIMCYNTATATMLGVPLQSKNPEKAVEFINLLHTDKDLYNLVVFGVEGVNYKKISDERVEKIENSGYDMKAQGWKFGNQFNQYLTPELPDGIWEKTKEINDNAERSEILGFFLDDSMITTEISQCTKVRQEYSKRISAGVEDPAEYYDEYLDKLKKAGVYTIRDEVQRQIDEFKKNNN